MLPRRLTGHQPIILLKDHSQQAPTAQNRGLLSQAASCKKHIPPETYHQHEPLMVRKQLLVQNDRRGSCALEEQQGGLHAGCYHG